ncbi:uncharacterized protein LY89DRAFT_657928 [Mollisia scopiformis]|uniref:Uncharacterized protein n=1 Tax=Mollisia scopiformis TaxID=149040 RepID=A0A132BAS8_MOLSC|nr:uncharacterized protein LY89DRAFT_657928 [Mollisia scopiformis]KUJ09520.1 hypothetical protein LY89DRAFT_657928 [Mollisia scopiformis]
MLTPAEAQREARERSTEVLAGWNKLRQILERHEDLLRKRWTKKTILQRTNILRGAWPKISSVHRPDYKAWRKEGSKLSSVGTTSREAYLWPYINVEDLVKGKNLLLFLNSRGRYFPYTFAHTDFEATHLGRITGATMPAFLNLHTMLLNGEGVETYGCLVAWEDDEDAMMKVFTGHEYQPGEALLILEIQQRILQFLVDCCHIILHDFTHNALVAEAPIESEPPPIKDTFKWPTWASISATAPYRVPAALDFNHLKALTTSKRNMAEGHIRDLREDPSYFADVVGDWSEHRQERLLDTNGVRHPILETPLFWDRVIRDVVSDAYGSLIKWDILSEQLKQLATLQEQYSRVISSQTSLPPEYTKALLTLRYTLGQVKNISITKLKTGTPASPPLRSIWVREPHIPGSSIIRLKTRKGLDYMLWLFHTLWTDDQLALLRLPGLMDEIENMISDAKESTRLSPWVARVFSDLGLIGRVGHELDIYQPWASSFDHEFIKYKAEIEESYQSRFATAAKVNRILKGLSLARLGEPIKGRFYYPSDKRRTKQNTESMRAAEFNLDVFWKEVDDHFLQESGSSLDEAVQHIFTEMRQLERTADWVEPTQECENNLLKTDEHALLPDLTPYASADIPTRFALPELKIKAKTRGLAKDTSEIVPNIPLPEETTVPQPIFVLNKRAFKVFRTLFFNSSNSDLPGEIPWTDFLYAMQSIGFAVEKLHGSAWQFTPLTRDVGQSIQFHEPHPTTKIAFRNARRIGRRLSRTYGWHGGMFTLA